MDDYKIKITLLVAAGEAAVAPPIGPILGQYGVNTIQFCEEFNELTSGASQFFYKDLNNDFGGFVLVIDVFVNYDRTYNFIIRKPTTSFLLRVLTNLPTCNPSGGVNKSKSKSNFAYISLSELFLLAQFKFPELSSKQACKILLGTARSIGVKIQLPK